MLIEKAGISRAQYDIHDLNLFIDTP